MIQKEIGRATSQRRKRPGASGADNAARSKNAATISVGARATKTSNTIRKMQKATTTAAKIFRRRYLSVSHNPFPWTFTSKYGMTISATTTKVGISTPATTGGK